MVQSSLLRATAMSHVFKLSMRAVPFCSSELSVKGFWRGKNKEITSLKTRKNADLETVRNRHERPTRTSPRSFLQTCSLPTGRNEWEKTLSCGCRRSLPAGDRAYHKQQTPITNLSAACEQLSVKEIRPGCQQITLYYYKFFSLLTVVSLFFGLHLIHLNSS